MIGQSAKFVPEIGPSRLRSSKSIFPESPEVRAEVNARPTNSLRVSSGHLRLRLRDLVLAKSKRLTRRSHSAGFQFVSEDDAQFVVGKIACAPVLALFEQDDIEAGRR